MCISLSCAYLKLICDWACENQSCEYKNIADFLSLLYHNLQTANTNNIKSLSTAEFNGLSLEINRNAIPYSELKIL